MGLIDVRRLSWLCLAVGLGAAAQTSTPDAPDGTAQLGGVGLENVRAATLVPHSIGFSAHAGYFQQANLTGDSELDEYRVLVVAASFSPLSWLEVSAAARSATYDQYTTQGPSRTPLETDLFFRAKAGRQVTSWIDLAAELGVRLPPPNAPGDSPFSAISPSAGALATFDLGQFHLPLRVHANLDFVFDQSKVLGLADQGRSLALSIDPYRQLREGVALEGRFTIGGIGWVPFLEHTLDVPLGASNFSAYPMRLTPGLRVLPWRGLVVDAAVDIGLSPNQIAGVAPVPQWMGWVSLGYAASVDSGQTQVVERVVEKPVPAKVAEPTRGALRGTVRDAITQKPLPDVVVYLPRRNGLVADMVGSFVASDVEPGVVKVRAEAHGYKSGEASVEVKPGQEAALELELRPLPPAPPKPMKLKGTILSEAGSPVSATVVTPAGDSAPTAEGEYELELPAGEVSLDVNAKGFLQAGRRLSGKPGDTIIADFVLKAVPKKTLVILKKDKIEIKKQVHFATNRDVILPDSDQLLDEVASTILQNAELIPKIRVEGHTDSQGDAGYNLTLSQRRAEAVVRALAERGIDPRKLDAAGFGKTKPIASNTTEQGRARNRRVEFIIEKPN